MYLSQDEVAGVSANPNAATISLRQLDSQLISIKRQVMYRGNARVIVLGVFDGYIVEGTLLCVNPVLSLSWKYLMVRIFTDQISYNQKSAEAENRPFGPSYCAGFLISTSGLLIQ
eukprot:g23723.t1